MNLWKLVHLQVSCIDASEYPTA